MKKEKGKNTKGFLKKSVTGVIAGALALTMAVGIMQPAVETYAAGKTTNIGGFSAVMIADPDTSEDDHIFNGTPAEDGKIWTDKSVTTGAMFGINAEEDNFTVALSAIAQTYNTVETAMSTDEEKYAFDVVFVLDFSGSMNYGMQSNSNSNATIGSTRADAMVKALNPAIATLMKNENSRIAVVGYSGSNVNSSSAATILSLDHYTASNSIYFTYGANNSRQISIASWVRDSSGNTESGYKAVNGGTPTQRGIYHGMTILQNASHPKDGVTRIPVMILLTDGKAGSAKPTYTTLSGNTLYEGDANNWYDDEEVGAYTILTANYAKTQIQSAYNKIYQYEDASMGAKFYTIGLGIGATEWTHFMLDPGTTEANGDNVVSGNRGIKYYLNNDATYKNNYDYADKSFVGQMTEAQLKENFENIVNELTIDSTISSTINPPISHESGEIGSENITFTDYLGYKMELKGDSQYLRYDGINYRFDKQSNNTYVFSGYDWGGNAVTGPALTINGTTYTLANVTFQTEFVNEQYNGQTGYWKVTWSFPSALLPTYSRLNNYDNTNVDPIRMIYQVGLEEDTDLQNDALKINPDGTLFKGNGNYDKLVFHSNLYDYEHGIAKTWASYKPAANNPFYYETGYSTDSNVAGTTDEYFRLDVIAESAKTETITANTNIVLADITLSPYNSQATFTYNGQTKTVALSGDWENGAPWTGEVSIPVTAESTDEIVIEQNISMRINAEMVWQSGRYPYLDLKEVTALEQNATISSDKETATLNLTLKKEIESDTAIEDEMVSIYLQIKEDTKGYYIEDTAGNRIDITKNLDGSYTATLGEKNYYSVPYYKYAQGKVSYVEKNLDKGTIAKALVGQFEIIQPGTTPLTENNFKNYFKYYPSNYKESSISYQATDVLFSDGTHWGSIEPDASVTKPAQGTIKVLVSGIQNGQIDVNGNPMIVNFVFTLEEQKLAGGKTQYVVVDCDYWETRDTYAVDMDVSDTAEITEDNKYYYDVSYTIESTHASGSANVTQTDHRFFASDFANSIVTGLLGNNGRLSVTADDIYDKDVIAQKEWRDSLGNLIPMNDTSLKNIKISAGIYRVYEYVDAEGNVISHSSSTTNATPYATVELNYENGFKAEWDNIDLPKYLISLSGDYILDRNNNKVPVTYEVAEVTGEDGWVLSNVEKSSETGKDTFTLINVPMAEFTPSVKKIWTKDGVETTAPSGYKVRMNLMKQSGANVIPVYVRSESAQQISVVLSQNSAETNARLNVFYEGGSLTEQEVLVSDFNNENTHKIYKFEYAPQGGLGGTVGSGAQADKVEIHVTVTNTSGDKLGIMNATATFYFTILEGENKGTQQSMSISAAPVSSEETGTEKRTVFELRNITTEEVSVVLDGSESWKHTWENLNLPLLEFDEVSNSYKNVTYSVEEILLVPDESENDGYKEYGVGTNGVIIVPQISGSRLFKTTYENTEDYQFTVTNDEGLTNIAAKKVWLDNNNKYDTRPSKIVFTLCADGVPVDGSAKEISVENAETLAIWSGTENAEWKNVPLYDGTTGKEIKYSVVETLETVAGADKYQTDYTVDDDGTFIVTNRLDEDPAINSTNMEVEKVWIDDNNAAQRRPDAIYMVLYRYVDGQEASTATVVPGTNSIITLTDSVLTGKWENLAKYNEEGKKYIYLVKEYDRLVAGTTEGVAGYEDVSTAADKTETKYTFRNQLDEGSISKTVTKVWNDKALENERPESVTVKLSGSIAGEENPVVVKEQTITAPWTYTWNNLPEFKDGKKIDYTVAETKVGNIDVVNGKATNYAVAVQDDGNGNSFVVTNTLTGETAISVTKVWENIPDGFTIPEVSFDVYNRLEGKKNITLTVTNDNRTATSGSLPKYNANGSEFVYYLIEQPIQETETYRINSVISQNQATDGTFAYTATNTYESLVRDIEGTKTWVDVVGDNIPGNITLKLLRRVNGGTDEVVTKDALGNDLQLTLQAQKDQNNITKNVWNYKFTNLPIFADPDDVSTRYIYSIEETKIGGVPVAQTDYQVNVFGLNITNTLDKDIEGEKLDGTKIWTDVNAADVPDSITVELWRNITGRTLERALDSAGNTVAAITVNKPTGTNANVLEWSFDFGDIDVPKYDEQGNEYTYSVKETHVTAGSTTKEVVYTTDTEGTVGDYDVALNGMNITNTIGTKELVQFPITKAWVAPASTSLPASITVQLMQDNIAFGSAVKLTQSTSGVTVEKDTETERTRWLYTFTDLPKYASDGITEYVYSVEETKVGNVDVSNGTAGGYVVTVNGNVISNKLSEQLTTSVSGKKTWVGVSGENIPDYIIIQLYQDSYDNLYEEQMVRGTGSEWNYTFDNLPLYKDGVNRHTYLVKESGIGGVGGVTYTSGGNLAGKAGDYEVTRDGLNFTNTLTGTVTLSGKKIWADNSNEAGNRPDSISVELYRGNDKIAEQSVTGTGNEWAFVFGDYPKYDAAGNLYTYTVKEQGEVNGLYTIKSGNEISHQYRVTYDQSNLTITNAIPTTGAAVISGTKTMAGRTFINSDIFKFELKAKTAGAPMPANTIASLNGLDGETTLPVTFGEIVFSKEGTYEYTVEEINDGIGGVTYDDTVWNVTIDVAYSTVDEKYVATVIYGNDANNTGFAFINNYKAGSVSLDGATNLVVKKEFTGRKDNEWRANDAFKFILTATGDTAAKVGTTVILPENASGITISSVDATGVGVGNFGDIIFTETGIYTFAISEVNEGKGGITYDTHVMNITVTVTDDNSGTLKAAAASTVNSNVFKNTYKAEKVTAQLSGTKTLTGRKLKDEFTFTISAHSETPNAPMPSITTVTNTVGMETEAKKYVGNIIFPAITYTTPGTYKYTIVENNNNLPGVGYDGQAVTAIVVVKDNHEGKLESHVSYKKNGVTAATIHFSNTYSAQSTFVTLTGEKTISDSSDTFVLHDGDFSFKITPAEVNPDSDPISETTVSNVGNTFTLANLVEYIEAGTYYYDITEVSGNKAGIEYDDTVYEVIVTITDTNAVLSHSLVIKKDGTVIENGTVDNIEFVNTYSPESATAVITGKKVFDGDKPLAAGMFGFELVPVGGAPMPLDVNGQPKNSIFATNDETGIFQFEHIKYTVGGIYKYVVKEVIPAGADASNNYTLNGITYDPNPHEVTVVITGPIPATGITLDQNEATVVVGKDITLTAAIAPADSTDEVLWASSDESVAIVDQNGKVTAVSVGTATVTASVGIYSATCEVTVSNENLTKTDESTQNLIAVETIELDKVEISLAVTAEESLMATVMPEDATDKTVTWNSSDEEVAIVDENGKVTAVADGTAAITAKAGEVEATCLVTVGTGVKIQANEEDGGNEPAPTNLEGDEEDSEPTGGGEQASILGGLSKMSPRRFFVTGANGDETLQPRINGTNEAKLYATVTYSDGEYVKITNSYDPKEVTIGGNTSIPISGSKELTGNRTLRDGEFSFKIEAVGNAPMPFDDTVENTGNVFSFGTITYSKTGTYYYTITEVDNNIPGIAYSEDSFTVKVEVTDEGYDGQLDAEVTYYSAPDTETTTVKFVNNYQAAPTKTQLALTKKLNGRALNANEFEFKIEAITTNAPMPLNATGEVAPIVTNDAAGIATFEEIIFNNAGTYEYKVTEIPGSLKYMTYDKTEYKVTIDVEDDGNGYLEVVKVMVENLTNPNQDPTIEESLVFTNTYKEPSKPKDPKPEEPEDDPKDEPEVYPAPPQPTVSTVAPTGDSANLAGLLGLLGAAVVGFLGIKTYKRKKQ